MDIPREQIDEIRAFNRFYTKQIGLLNEGLLQSEFAISEARVLYELAHRDGMTASDLRRDLGLDAGYLSRMLKKLESRDLITRRVSGTDARQSILALTPQGRDAFDGLNNASNDEIGAILAKLPATERSKLVTCMRSIRRALGDASDDGVPYILRPPEVGDYGWIIHRQSLLYHHEYGWDEGFEALIADLMSGYIRNFDPDWERGWVAERDGEVIGSIFCVKSTDEIAKLRMLYVDSSARGLGIGSRLVDEVIRFARAKGYKALTLWTNDILVSARRIYEAAGFQLESEKPHRAFGKDLTEQTWTLKL